MIHPFPRETTNDRTNPAKNRIGPPRAGVWLSGWRVSFFYCGPFIVGPASATLLLLLGVVRVLLCWCHCEAELALTHVNVAAADEGKGLLLVVHA